MKTATTVTLILLAAASLLLAACTSDSGATQIALERAEATAQAAISERDDAIQRAESAEQRAAAAEKSEDRLSAIKQRGEIVCATGNDTPGFYSLDQSGQSIGFDVDLCRAVAAAVVGDADAVDYRFIDLAARGAYASIGRSRSPEHDHHLDLHQRHQLG